MTATVHILVYGFSTDFCDEYLKIGETTAIESRKCFCDAVIALYEDHSILFDTIIYDRMPPVNYVVNGHQHTLGYYLSDGIYPRWATLMQTIAHLTIRKERLFAKKQEAIRKDVE
ncbi:hypothetical protein L1049_021593 [Liquidambar formosana]|uniref:Protein ALP1-like n=1 Tax=Liquidambar formosana TaxID=63359 RepID=A0AAP0N4S9_LIQFO